MISNQRIYNELIKIVHSIKETSQLSGTVTSPYYTYEISQSEVDRLAIGHFSQFFIKTGGDTSCRGQIRYLMKKRGVPEEHIGHNLLLSILFRIYRGDACGDLNDIQIKWIISAQSLNKLAYQILALFPEFNQFDNIWQQVDHSFKMILVSNTK